jgi:hypothetical protein
MDEPLGMSLLERGVGLEFGRIKLTPFPTRIAQRPKLIQPPEEIGHPGRRETVARLDLQMREPGRKPLTFRVNVA